MSVGISKLLKFVMCLGSALLYIIICVLNNKIKTGMN